MNKNKLMGKLIMFEQDADSYFDRAVSAAEDGNYLSALQNARRAARMDSYSTDSMMLIAEIYTEMGLYYQSINQYFKALAFDEDAVECYIAIGQNFYMLDSSAAALKFIKRGIEGAWDSEYLSQARSVLESIGSEKKFHVISGAKNNEILISMAKSLISDGAYEAAAKLLNFIPEDSDCHQAALLQKSVCARHLKDYETAEKFNEKYLSENPEDVHALCNQARIYLETDRIPQSAELLDELSGLTNCGREENYAVAAALLDSGREEEAIKFLERFLGREPYEVGVLLLLGQAYYNRGELDKAQECFLTVLTLEEGNIVARYYNRYVQQSRLRRKPRLEYRYQLTLAEANKVLKGLIKALQMPDGEFEVFVIKSKSFFDELTWLYGVDRPEIASRLNDKLAALGSEEAVEFLLLALADLRVPDIIKRSVLMSLLRYGCVKRLALVLDDDIKFLSASRPKALNGAPKAWREAYIAVFAALAFTVEGFVKRLNAAVNKLLKSLGAKAAQFTSERELACLIAYRASEAALRNLPQIIKVFDADAAIVHKYFEMSETVISAEAD